MKFMNPAGHKSILLLAFFILAATLVTIVAVVAARPDAIDPLDPPAPVPTPAPSDWLTPGHMVRHLDVVPVSLKKVPVRQISLPRPQSGELIKPTPDGGCLAIQTVAAPGDGAGASGGGSGGGSAAPRVHLRAIRYKADGAVLWDRTDAADRFEGYPMSFCVWADGSFAVGLQTYESIAGTSGPGSGDMRFTARLLRYAADGTRLWAADAGLTPAGSLEHLFALADGSLLSAGIDETAQVNGARLNQIRLQRFDASGRSQRQRQMTLPGSAEAGHQMITGASFMEGIGLALAWRSIPSGQITFGERSTQAMVLTLLDANLDEKWSVRLADDIGIGSVNLLPDQSGMLALGSRLMSRPTPTAITPGAAGSGETTGSPPVDSGTGSTSTLFHVDPQGRIDWTYAAGAGRSWLVAAERTIDGQYIVGEYRVHDDGSETTALLTFSGNGQSRRELDAIPGRIEQIVTSADGGFTAVLQQPVQALPQPPYISSLWTDTEAIVCQYNRRLQLVWRRKIDQYKHTMRSDVVIVTTQDRLLAG